VVPVTAASVPFTPAGGVAATNVQAAIAEVDAEKATITYVDTQDATKASLAVANTWTAVQGYPETALTYTSGGTTAWNAATAPIATVAMATGNSTMGAPTNVTAGRVYTIRIAQDTSPRTLAWNSAFKWTGGVANTPVISTGSGAVDRFTFMGRAGNVLEEVGRAQGIA
jgi:hypothetical protein